MSSFQVFRFLPNLNPSGGLTLVRSPINYYIFIFESLPKAEKTQIHEMESHEISLKQCAISLKKWILQ